MNEGFKMKYKNNFPPTELSPKDFDLFDSTHIFVIKLCSVF